MDVHESIQTKVFRITFTKTAISIETEMGMEISVVPVVYKVKKRTATLPNYSSSESNLTAVGSAYFTLDVTWDRLISVAIRLFLNRTF